MYDKVTFWAYALTTAVFIMYLLNYICTFAPNTVVGWVGCGVIGMLFGRYYALHIYKLFEIMLVAKKVEEK